MDTKEKTIRDSRFELLRILSILLIIAYHYCIHGNNGTIFYSGFCINQVISAVVGSWGLLGVTCFVFVSAYFLIDNGKFSSKKLLKILLQTIFYSVVIAAVLYFCGIVQFNPILIIKTILSPLFLSHYWYVTVYCMLYIMFPFINKVIPYLNNKIYYKILILLTIFIPIYGTLWENAPSSEFGLMIYLYLLMGYLKHNPKNWFERNAKMGFCITSICIFLFDVAMSYVGTITDIGPIKTNAFMFAERFSPLMTLDAIFLFYIFNNLKIKMNPVINTIAGTTLGIYLIHEHPLLREVLWDGILQVGVIYHSPAYILYLLASVAVLFVSGVVIDLVRIRFIEKPLFNIKIKCFEKVISRIDSWMNVNS